MESSWFRFAFAEFIGTYTLSLVACGSVAAVGSFSYQFDFDEMTVGRTLCRAIATGTVRSPAHSACLLLLEPGELSHRAMWCHALSISPSAMHWHPARALPGLHCSPLGAEGGWRERHC